MEKMLIEILFKERIIAKKELETWQQKEKLLMMSNFSICYHVFKSRLLQICQNVSACGKELKMRTIHILFKPDILKLCFNGRENHVDGKFYEIYVCKLLWEQNVLRIL